jgi:fumarylacetoacetate (FAA) hydrolase
MKLISYLQEEREQLGVLVNNEVYRLRSLHPVLPETMDVFLETWQIYLNITREAIAKRMMNPETLRFGIHLKHVQLLAPVPKPSSLRDGYAFRQHVETARRNRGLEMTTAFDEFPVFYFGNHRTICGPGAISCMPDHFEELDYELEVAVVISKKGKNISAREADHHIAGLMILNDFSARRLQIEEMQLNLGPAKGKDFATATGPWLVTLDELKDFEVAPKENHVGKNWDLTMTASVNGEVLSVGRLSDMDWTFAELIERASYGVDLYPGDIIGSGTVGTGCLLELNGTGKGRSNLFAPRWLQPGDIVDLKVDGLGTLRNKIEKVETDYSILEQKKSKNELAKLNDSDRESKMSKNKSR